MRDAKQMADVLVRRIIDGLDCKQPPSDGSSTSTTQQTQIDRKASSGEVAVSDRINKKEMRVIDEVLGMTLGYVLHFSDKTFGEFFAQYDIDIDDASYRLFGDSKAKRLRCFLQTAASEHVPFLLERLLEERAKLNWQDTATLDEYRRIVERLQVGAAQSRPSPKVAPSIGSPSGNDPVAPKATAGDPRVSATHNDCSFKLDRSTYHRTLLAGLPGGCQFNGAAVLQHDGRHWCTFHLPLAAKAAWSGQQKTDFNQRVIEIVEKAAKSGTLLDLCGVAFPTAIQFDRKPETLSLPNSLFMHCAFADDIRFENVEFAGWVYFNGSKIRGQALLQQIAYAQEAHFDRVEFGHNAHLGRSTFRGNAYFQGAKFPGNTWCSDITFAGRAWFQEATFGGYSYFERCTFGGEADFSTRQAEDEKLAFPTITFAESIFKDRSCFTNRRFASSTSFAKAVFHIAPEFHGCRFHQDTDLSETTFLDRGNTVRAEICGVEPHPVDAARAYRTLKHAMETLRNADDEARFLALEQESLRSVQRAPSPPVEREEDILGYRINEQSWMKPLPAIVPADITAFRAAAEHVELLILTVKNHERDAVLRLMSPIDGDAIRQGFLGQETYYWGKFGAYRAMLTACSQGSHGRDGSALAANFGIQTWNPDAVIMIGFAWGAGPQGPNQKMTDVLVSASIIPFDPRRESIDGAIPRGVPIPAGPVLLNRFRHAHGWSFKRPDLTAPDVHIGPVVSGEWLVDSLRRKRELLEWFPAAIGGEMEGTGISSAAARFENMKEWIIVKAICDWADGSKTKLQQPLAAATAASFCHHVLSNSYALASLVRVGRREA